MACVYVLRHGNEDVFKIGRTKSTIDRTINQLSRGNPYRLTEFARIETEDEVACETFLHQRLRTKRVVKGGGNEFFQIDPIELNAAIDEAKEFVTEFIAAKAQADELSRIETDAALASLKPSESDLVVYSNLLSVRESQDRLRVQREFLEAKLKLRMGRACSMEGIATWKGQWRQNFDIQAFRAAEADLYAELFRRFGTESYKRFFRIQRFE
jgi:Meiotically up-regulated gene 113